MRRMISTLNIMNFFSESSYVTVPDDSSSVEVIIVMQVQATKTIEVLGTQFYLMLLK